MDTIIRVNEKFPLFSKSVQNMKGLDGSVFESLEEGSGYFLTIFLNNPSEEEIRLFQDKINFRLFKEKDHILPLIRFGNSDFIFEMDLDPTLYKDKRALQMLNKNNILSLALVDSASLKVKGLREGNLPLKVIKECTKVWKESYNISNYSKEHKKWYLNIRQTMHVKTVWDKSIMSGSLGETFNLNHLKY